jgi:hypothetical protein
MLRKFSYQSLFALAVLVLSVIACGGGGNANNEATNTPAPTATPDITANFISITSETSGVIVSYPSDWVTDDSFFLSIASNAVLLESTESQEGAIMIFLSDTPANLGGNDPKAILTETVASMSADSGFLTNGDPTDLTVKGQSGAIVEVTGTADDETPLTGFVAIVINGEWATVIMAITPTDGSEDYLPTMRAILNTVEVTEAPAPDESALLPTEEPIVEEPTPVVEEPEPTVEPTVDVGITAAAETISQWASSATASSQFSSSWAATNATGAPDTPECGDYTTAWASSSSTGVDWLEVYYDVPVFATEINIYESYNPDQIVTVELIAVSGEVVEVYTQAPEGFDTCPMFLSVTVPETDFLVQGVRITVDQSVLNVGWNEIDAVELIGYPAN